MEAVLVTGSRSWTDRLLIEQIVSTYEYVVVGCAKGADKLAREAAAAHGCMLKVFTADWAKEPRRAGILRNAAMVSFCMLLRDDGILVHVHAFWDGKSTGTANCISLAERARFPAVVHRRDAPARL